MTKHDNNQKVIERLTGKGVWIRCDACGTTRKYERGEPLYCHYCYNAPEEVVLDGGIVYLGEEERRRWL